MKLVNYRCGQWSLGMPLRELKDLIIITTSYSLSFQNSFVLDNSIGFNNNHETTIRYLITYDEIANYLLYFPHTKNCVGISHDNYVATAICFQLLSTAGLLLLLSYRADHFRCRILVSRCMMGSLLCIRRSGLT